MNIKELIEMKGNIIYQMKTVSKLAKDEKRLLTEEEMEKFSKWDDELNEVQKNLDVQKQIEDLAAKMAKPVKADDPKGMTKEESKEEAKADFVRFLKGEVRANVQAKGTDSLGGYTVPTTMLPMIETALLEYGGMYANSTVIRTEGGETLNWPTVNDTGNTGGLTAESGDMSSGATALTFGTKTLGAYKYDSDLLVLTNELLQDSSFDIFSYVADQLAVRIHRALNAAFTSGTGSAQPEGFITNATKGEDALARAITRTDIINLLHSVDPAYRRSPKCAFTFNDSTLKYIKALTIGSSDARPLWQPGMAYGEPDTLEGHKYFVNQDMEDIHPTYKPVAFGDFGKYIIREALPIQVIKLVERYAEKGQTGIVLLGRWDAILSDAGTNPIKFMRNSTT